MHALDGALLHPRHEGAQALADAFDRVLFAGFEKGVVLLVAAVVFLDPAPGEFAGLNVLQGRLHSLLDPGVNDLGADAHVAPLGRFGDGEPHAADAGFVHQIHDQLQLVQAFKIGHFRLVTGFDQRFKTGHDQGRGPAAQHGLFAEKVRFGLFLEAGLDDPRARGADALGIRERRLERVTRVILVHGQQCWDALTLSVDAPYEVAGTFGRDHKYVHVCRGDDLVIVNVESVRK